MSHKKQGLDVFDSLESYGTVGRHDEKCGDFLATNLATFLSKSAIIHTLLQAAGPSQPLPGGMTWAKVVPLQFRVPTHVG